MIRTAPTRACTLLLAVALVACQPAPTLGPSVPPEKLAPSPTLATTNHFEAPGVAFDYPLEWADQSGSVGPDPRPSRRAVASLSVGMTLCPADTEPESPAIASGECALEPTKPGQLRFDVWERVDLFPGFRSGVGFRPDDLVMDEWGVAVWSTKSPDGGYYSLELRIPRNTVPADRLRTQMRNLLASLVIEPRGGTGPAPEGPVRLPSGSGFSIEAPAGWTRYYPIAWDRDVPIVAVASQPVLPRKYFGGSGCSVFQTPPGTAVLVFSAARGATFLTPDWTNAPETLGGQPAFFRIAKDVEFPTCVEVAEAWTVRLPGERGPLRIDVFLSGPDIASSRASAQGILESLVIDPSPATD